MNAHEKKGWIERLQALDEPIKRKVLIVATAVAMAVVIYFWLAYFNNLVAGIAAQPAAAPEQSSQAASGGPSVWQNLEGGMASMYARFMGAAHAFGNILQAPRQYIINPK